MFIRKFTGEKRVITIAMGRGLAQILCATSATPVLCGRKI
jgi:hypothetical protein